VVCVHAAPFFGRGMFREIADSSLLALVGWGRGGFMIRNNCGVCACDAFFWQGYVQRNS